MDKLLSGRRVLVVEDEMLVLIMIEDMLADLGCKSVTSAATVEKALALVDAQAFDFVMLDENLNGSDSRPVAEALFARGVPFVYSTGNTAHSSRDGYPDSIDWPKSARRDEARKLRCQPIGASLRRVSIATSSSNLNGFLIRRKTEEGLIPWIERARASLVASFASGVAKDEAAVRAAISSLWSNGQTEGQITRLKLVKRQMYGRGKIDLLQARLIGAE
jgi:CheY-like chemotaxis protein